MTAEAVIIELFNGGRPIRYTCAEATGIAKGALLQISGDRTVSAHSGVDQPIAGIAAFEKVASDGSTTISVYTDGIFDLTAAAAGVTALGARCAGSGTANMITVADAADILQSSDVGMCYEAHANDEVAAVRINK
jgi:hypothetical protein